jgi:hypothetical protein
VRNVIIDPRAGSERRDRDSDRDRDLAIQGCETPREVAGLGVVVFLPARR